MRRGLRRRWRRIYIHKLHKRCKPERSAVVLHRLNFSTAVVDRVSALCYDNRKAIDQLTADGIDSGEIGYEDYVDKTEFIITVLQDTAHVTKPENTRKRMDCLQGMCTFLFALKQILLSEDQKDVTNILNTLQSLTVKYPFVMEQIEEFIKISLDEKLQTEYLKPVKNSRNSKISARKLCTFPRKNNQPPPQDLITSNKFEVLNEIANMDSDNVDAIIQKTETNSLVLYKGYQSQIETNSLSITDWSIDNLIIINATTKETDNFISETSEKVEIVTRPNLCKEQPIWAEMKKENYREYLNALATLTQINIKYNITQQMGIIKNFNAEEF